MAEERTVSTFTWLTPALRARMSVGTMSAMTQVRQFYRTESKVCSSNFELIVTVSNLIPAIASSSFYATPKSSFLRCDEKSARYCED